MVSHRVPFAWTKLKLPKNDTRPFWRWRYIIRLYIMTLPYFGRIMTYERLRSVLRWLQPHKQLVGDKFPPYWRSLQHYKNVENRKVIIIYRDVRDVVASYLKKINSDWQGNAWTENKQSPETIAKLWVQMIGQMEANTDHIYTIKYEDLVTNPTDTLHELATYLEVDPTGFDSAEITSANIGKHKTTFTTEQIATIEAIAGDTMRHLGYA